MTEPPKKKTTVRKTVAKKRVTKKVVTPRVKKPKKLTLTVMERRLLEYPPTPTTWKCTCGMVNGGSAVRCFVCATHQGEGTTLLYEVYTKACDKVGIIPGQKWKYSDKLRTPIYQAPGERWKPMEPTEGLVV
jgi:hypothetical protein